MIGDFSEVPEEFIKNVDTYAKSGYHTVYLIPLNKELKVYEDLQSIGTTNLVCFTDFIDIVYDQDVDIYSFIVSILNNLNLPFKKTGALIPKEEYINVPDKLKEKLPFFSINGESKDIKGLKHKFYDYKLPFRIK